MEKHIIIEEQCCRPKFSSNPFRKALLAKREISLSKSSSGSKKRQSGEKPRVLLFVPPYTRAIESAPQNSPLRKLGIETEEVMKRAGTPIGLVRIATEAKARGYEVKIVDSPFEDWNHEEPLLYLPNGGKLIRYGLTDTQIRKIIDEFRPDVVGIQCNYTVQWGNARALSDLIKTIDQKIVVVMGGAHTSGDWKNAIMDSPADIICMNESDKSFSDLLDALTTDRELMDVSGIVYRKNNQIVKTQRKPYVSITPDKNGMLVPDFSLLNMSNYELPYHSAGARVRKTGAWAQIFSTIGCNVGCDFCYIPMVNGPWRNMGYEWFDRHLAEIKKRGVTEVLLEDDHLLHDPLYATVVFRMLKKHDLPWVEEGGLSLFNLIILHKGKEFLNTLPEKEQRSPIYKNVIEALDMGLTAELLIRQMADSGCYGVYLAVESANEESLSKSNKPTINTIQEATIEIVKMFADSGIKVTGGFMLGFVNPPKEKGGKLYIESKEQMRNTVDYAVTLIKAGMDYANPFIVTPLPGTRMWEFQQQFVVRDYDFGWSHERATLATEKWTADELESLRWELMIEANGAEKTKEMILRGTWPV
ncbi:MAG: radical SAM protein [Candidatus Micrarchaeota archaeon]|nr:radical SAM protein [Candidatus Micrarchaeota archaeon]